MIINKAILLFCEVTLLVSLAIAKAPEKCLVKGSDHNWAKSAVKCHFFCPSYGEVYLRLDEATCGDWYYCPGLRTGDVPLVPSKLLKGKKGRMRCPSQAEFDEIVAANEKRERERVETERRMEEQAALQEHRERDKRVKNAIVDVIQKLEKNNVAKTFKDERDGSIYHYTTVGTQIWMIEPMHYKTSKSWCYLNDEQNCSHGRLYDDRVLHEVCPDGWHIPTNREWDILGRTLTIQRNSNLKPGSTLVFKSGSVSTTPLLDDVQDYGIFSSPKAGFHGFQGKNDRFYDEGKGAYFWGNRPNEGYFYLQFKDSGKIRNGIDRYSHSTAYSVRCISDDNLEEQEYNEKINSVKRNVKTGSFTDSRDNSVYKYVAIGDQIWMAENLHYDGKKEYPVSPNFFISVTPWEAPMDVLCPIGWHIPTIRDWGHLFWNVLGRPNDISEFREKYEHLMESGLSLINSNEMGFSGNEQSFWTKDNHFRNWIVNLNCNTGCSDATSGFIDLPKPSCSAGCLANYTNDYGDIPLPVDAYGNRNTPLSIRCIKDNSDLAFQDIDYSKVECKTGLDAEKKKLFAVFFKIIQKCKAMPENTEDREACMKNAGIPYNKFKKACGK